MIVYVIRTIKNMEIATVVDTVEEAFEMIGKRTDLIVQPFKM